MCRSGEQCPQTPKDFNTPRNTRPHVCVLSPSPTWFGLLLVWPSLWTEHSPWADFLQLLQTLSVTAAQGFCALSSLCQMLFPQEISWGKSPSSLLKCLHLREVFLTIIPNRASHSSVLTPFADTHFFFLLNIHPSPICLLHSYLHIYLLSAPPSKMPALEEQSLDLAFSAEPTSLLNKWMIGLTIDRIFCSHLKVWRWSENMYNNYLI